MTILDLLSRKSLRILILWLWQSSSIVGLYGIPILQFPESASVKPRIPIVPVIQQSLKIAPALHPACFVRSCANCLLPGSTTMPESARSQFLRSLNSQQVTQVRGRRGPEAGFERDAETHVIFADVKAETEVQNPVQANTRNRK